MASRVDFAVSATPVYSHAAGEGAAVDVIARDVGKKLGGSGSLATSWGSTEGYGDSTAGVADYKSATTSASSLDTLTSIVFLFIKHSGYTDSNLDTATTAKLTVSLGASTVVAILNAGDAIILPYATATSPDIQVKSASSTIAVEYMATFSS